MITQDFLNYYLSPDFNPELPSEVNFRHFRFKLEGNNIWRKVPEKITSKDELVKWIVKLGGLDIYYGTSRWLNPHKVSTKGHAEGTYFVADNIFLGNDLVFDIDADEPICIETLEEARKSTWNIYQAMKDEPAYELEYAAFTGKKGFRLAYKDFNKDMPAKPLARLDWIENSRKIFIERLLLKIKANEGKKDYYKVKTRFDEKITTNPMCVVRVIGTGHSGTGFISSKINVTELKQPVKKILSRIPFIGKRRPVIPTREMIKDKETLSPRSRLHKLANDASGLASLPTTPKGTDCKHFVSNRVLGIKRGYIPVFKYPKCITHYEEELISLQQQFNLGHIYVFEDENNYYGISLKIMQKRNLQKVLNQSSSRVKYEFIRHGKILVPFFINFDKKIKGKFTGNLSRGHFYWLDNGPPVKGLYAGWDKVELVTGYKEKQDVN